MQGAPAIYLGKIVNKDHFRVFIYSSNGDKKLVESWDEYESNMKTGVWFSTNELKESDIGQVIKPVEVKKSVKKIKNNQLAFEVSNNDLN